MPQRRDQVATDPDLVPDADASRRVRHKMVLDTPLVIAAGGALGASARYGLAVWLSHEQGLFPWAAFWTNVVGCVLIGVLMVLLTEVAGHPHRLLRPFIGVGLLGGFTTFSTYTVDVHQLLAAGASGTALAYMFATLAAALVAAEVGMVITRRATRVRLTGKDRQR